MTVAFGKVHYRVEPGRLTTVVYTIDERGPWSLAFKAHGGRFLDDLRAVSVLSTPPMLERSGVPGVRDSASA